MNCAFDKEKLSGYYDGELDAAEKAEVERHIASCSECLRELGELKSAAILVKELPRLRAPRSIADGIQKEIQAAGRVHSFARVRRTVMWAASAAAAVFIGLNVIYFSAPKEKQEAGVAARAASPAPALGRALPAEDPAAPAEARQKAVEEPLLKDGRDEARRKESVDRERKLDAPAIPKAEEAPSPKLEEKRPSAVTEAPARRPAPAAEPAKPAAAPPPAAVPPPPPAPSAPATAAAPRPEPKPAEAAPADKAAPMKKESDGQAGLKQKAADAGPTHLTLATTQLARSRLEAAEALKKMGIVMPPPPSAAMVKGVARSGAREETVNVFELTDAQIARLRAELDKPGNSMLMTAKPEDPVMAQFKRGGMFEAKKDVASGGASAKKFGDSKPEAAKEAEDAAPGKAAPAEGAAAEKSGEPRRKVVLHFLEVPFVPDRQPASDALKK